MTHPLSTRVRSSWSTLLACAGLLAACGDDGGTPPDAAAPADAARLDAAPPDAVPAPPVSPIGEARSEADGTLVTVEGYVTVPSGTFYSATGEQGFAIQDDSAGVYVKMVDKLDLALNTRVRVTGVLGEMAQLRIIDAATTGVTTLSGTQTIAPQVVATGEVDEDVEGRLIEVAGALTRAVEEDPPYGLRVFIDDGSGEIQVFVHVVDGVGVIDTEDLEAGTAIEVVGLAAQYEAVYEVAPRQASDLVVVPPAAGARRE
jgi:DNA/RNA endonuclease YhcR with UshA esterase domain